MRVAEVQRESRETNVRIAINLDQHEEPIIHTPVPLFSHFLLALALHSGIGVTIDADGDVDVDPHHLIEDVGIVMGLCLDQALGNRLGIARFGQRLLPMDEALILTAVDLSGRGQLYWRGDFPDRPINGVSAEVWSEFFVALARNARMTLHVQYLFGTNAHHVYEATFKAVGRALRESIAHDGQEHISSTKGVL